MIRSLRTQEVLQSYVYRVRVVTEARTNTEAATLNVAYPSSYALDVRPHRVYDLAFSPRAPMLAAGGDELSLWNVAEDSLIRQTSSHKEGAWEVTYSANGTFLASTDEERVHIWRGRDGRLAHRLDYPELSRRSYHADFNSGNTLLTYVWGRAEDVRVWRWNDRESVFRLPKGANPDDLKALSFAPESNEVWGATKQALHRWRLGDRTYTGADDIPFPAKVGEPKDVKFNAEGTLLATSHRGRILLWRAQDVRLLRAIPLPFSSVPRQIEFSADGSMLLALDGRGKRISIYHVEDGGLWLTMKTNRPEEAEEIALSADGRYLAASIGGYPSSVRLWDLAAKWTAQGPFASL